MGMSRWFTAAVALAVLALAFAPAAGADVQTSGGTVAADTAATAYPTQPGVTYRGALNPDNNATGYHDLDYLALTASAGETIEFTEQNTTTGIDPSSCAQFCPVYLSLDKPNPAPPPDAVGLCSGAGTIATYGDTEIFDWTFGTAGTYYMIMESDGDVPLSYAVSYTVVAAGGGTDSCQSAGSTGGKGSGCTHHCGPGSGGSSGSTSSPPAPLVRLVRVAPNQRGTSVTATLNLGRWAKFVRVALLLAHTNTSIVSIRRAPAAPGHHRYELALGHAYRATLSADHKLSLLVRIAVDGSSGGSESFDRYVKLSR